MSIQVLISHAHDEKALAEALQKLLEQTSLSAVSVWFSSDSQASGGMPAGGEWRHQLYDRLRKSDFVIAVQTPASAARPWIMWECGVASGIDHQRGIIPIVYAMGKGDLANPLNTYQVYSGENESDVREVCKRLITRAGLSPQPYIFEKPIEVYLSAIKLHQQRKQVRAETMALWRSRFEELIRTGRANEVPGLRQAMYAPLGKNYQPIDPTVHELLSRILFDQQRYEESLAETEYALQLLNNDIPLLHRKALILASLGNRQDATSILEMIYATDATLNTNPELAGLEGRLYRELWQNSQDPAALDHAIDAYRRAYEADRSQYYPGINAASLLLAKGEIQEAEGLYDDILIHCREQQRHQPVSFWVDFTAGEALLGKGLVDAALEEYRTALTRNPIPSARDTASALQGIRRIAGFRNMPPDLTRQLEKLFTQNRHHES